MSSMASSFFGPLKDGWTSKRLKYLATLNDEVLPEGTDPALRIEYVEISDVSLTNGIERTTALDFDAAPSRARRRVKRGDVLVSTVRTYLKAIAAVPEAQDNLVASTGFCVVRPRAELAPRFAGWVAKSEPFVSDIVSRSVGVSYPAIKPSEVGVLEVPVPNCDEQKRIADFLDERTARIDGLIEKKERLLKLLAEKRQALITRAVTKGLDPTAPMKPSGIDWLGDIPAHWDVLPLRRAALHVKTGRTPSTIGNDYFDGGSISWFTPGDFSQSLTLSGSARKVTPDALADGTVPEFPPGSVLLVSIGATLGKVGVAEELCSSNQQINSIEVASTLSCRYLAHFLSTHEEVVRVSSNANTLGILNQDKTKALLIPRLPIAEQVSIVDHADREAERLDFVAKRVVQSVGFLRQLRASLITAAVTGQLDPEVL